MIGLGLASDGCNASEHVFTTAVPDDWKESASRFAEWPWGSCLATRRI